MAPKVDPQILEKAYVTSDLSLREIARRHELSWSALAQRARRRDVNGLTWHDKKARHRESIALRAYEKTADKFAAEESEIRSELINVNRATLAVYIEQLKKGDVRVTPKDAVASIASLLLLLGEPTSRSESKIVEFTTGGLDPEVRRRLIEFARAKVIDGAVAEPAGAEPT